MRQRIRERVDLVEAVECSPIPKSRGLPKPVQVCRPSDFPCCSLDGVHTCKGDFLRFCSCEQGRGSSKSQSRSQGFLLFGFPRVRDLGGDFMPVSTPLTSSASGILRPHERMRRVRRVGARCARSRRLIAVLCRPQWSANASWLNPDFVRSSLIRAARASSTFCIN